MVARYAFRNHGNLDSALLALEANLGDLDHVTITVDPFVLATPKGHPLSRMTTPLARNRLRGESMLLRSRSALTETLHKIAEAIRCQTPKKQL